MAYKDNNDPRAAQAKRRHYLRNREKYIEQAKRQRAELKKFVRELKGSQPCTDCGGQYPYYVMHYDHISDDKVDGVSRVMLSGSKPKVLAEIAKCELVCANCHAERTHSRISHSAR